MQREGVWTPKHLLRRFLEVPNASSPGIWRIWDNYKVGPSYSYGIINGVIGVTMDKLYNALYNATSSVLGGTGRETAQWTKVRSSPQNGIVCCMARNGFICGGQMKARKRFWKFNLGRFIFGRVNLGKVLWNGQPDTASLCERSWWAACHRVWNERGTWPGPAGEKCQALQVRSLTAGGGLGLWCLWHEPIVYPLSTQRHL